MNSSDQQHSADRSIHRARRLRRNFRSGLFSNSAFLRSSYKFGIVTFGWQTDYLSGGPFERGFGVFGDPRVNQLNVVRDYWLHDAQLRFDPTIGSPVYFNVDNVFDKKPQLLPGAIFLEHRQAWRHLPTWMCSGAASLPESGSNFYKCEFPPPRQRYR